ncbi:hypothetical protein [Dysgonomonas sp. 216]|uniref:hypothetical protein n=1 Tax=Dysgonomonas sp. 216 TaxID=2302934 RepID=UPI0013D2E5E2|nr:hypothetical protein [Dysgonomonas sp. 216]
MKKAYLFVLTLSVSIIFAACSGGSGGPLNPKAFNDKAISIFEGATKTLDAFDAKITQGVKSNDLASIGEAAQLALTDIDAKIEAMKALNIPEGADAYKESVLKSLQSLKSIVETGKKYSELKEGYSKKEFNALEKEYNNKRKQLSADLKSVSKAASAFMKSSVK